MAYRYKTDLYTLLHEVSVSMGRGPRQGAAVRPGQNKVLKLLNKNGEMYLQELLKELGIRAASLSELVSKLEKDGFVERRTGKRGKEVIVSITEKGRISALECQLSEQEREDELFSCLDERDREDLVRVLNKLLAEWRKDETDGERREKRWAENAKLRDELLEVNERLDRIEAAFKEPTKAE